MVQEKGGGGVAPMADGDAEGSDFLVAFKRGNVHEGAGLEEKLESGQVACGGGAVKVGYGKAITGTSELGEGNGSGVAGAASGEGGEQDSAQEHLEEAGGHEVGKRTGGGRKNGVQSPKVRLLR